jgi:hypothetical protein
VNHQWHATLLPTARGLTTASPEAELLSFLESTYEAAAELAAWDRGALEWGPGEQPRGRG